MNDNKRFEFILQVFDSNGSPDPEKFLRYWYKTKGTKYKDTRAYVCRAFYELIRLFKLHLELRDRN